MVDFPSILNGASDLLKKRDQIVNSPVVNAISDPVIKAELIVTTLNSRDKSQGGGLGVDFKREGTLAIAPISQKQFDNLMKVYADLTEAETKKFAGDNIQMTIQTLQDSTQPNGKSNRFMIDAKQVKDIDQFKKGLEFFKSNDGGAAAMRVAMETGDVEAVRKVMKTTGPAKGPDQGASTPSTAASEPAAAASEPAKPAKKPNALDMIRDKFKPKTTTPDLGGQSSIERPIDVTALASELGLKAPAATQASNSPTYGGTAKERGTDRNVG